MTEWEYQYWRDRLDGKPVEMNPSNPQAGFYRQPRKAHYGARRTYRPVAYWHEDGVLKCRLGDEDISPERGQGIWESVGAHPVTEEAYRAVAQENLPWPDEHELVPMAGDNLPPDEESFEGLRDAVEPLAQDAEKRLTEGPIKNQDEADRIANLTDRLAELWKKIEEARKAERRPHDEALKAIQVKWTPLLLLAESYRNLKHALTTPWELKKKADAKKAAEEAEAEGRVTPPPPKRGSGTRGKRQTLRTSKSAEIVDYEACLAAFKDGPEVRATVQDCANRAVRAGLTVPGVKVIEKEQVV